MLVRLISSSFAPTETGNSLVVKKFQTKFTLVVRFANFFRFFLSQSTCMVNWPIFLAYSDFSLRSSASFSLRFSSRLSSNATDALSRNSYFQFRSRFGWILFSTARVLRSFSPFNSSITRSDLNFALKFLLCLDMILNPLFHTDCSISDSLKSVRKSVLIYETIIEECCGCTACYAICPKSAIRMEECILSSQGH